MRRVVAALLMTGLLVVRTEALAHRIDEYLQATLLSVDADRIQGSMRLIPGEIVASSVIAAIDKNRDGVFSEPEQRAYAQRVLADLSITVDAKAVNAQLGSWDFPPPEAMRQGVGEAHIEYTVALPQRRGDQTFTIANHHRSDQSVYLVNVLSPTAPGIRIVGQRRNEQQSLYELTYQNEAGATQSAGALSIEQHAWWQDIEIATLFRLGMQHIAEGTDHQMFLLTLLLPAPLLPAGRRWGAAASVRRSFLRVLGIVTAFTLGHSLTLTLAAVGGLTLPARPVEVLIALSILVSAIHALRPLFPGKEAWAAGGFGLIHGLAFAATLDHLGLGLWPRVAGTLAFNLGIEAMQLLVIAAVLPSLLLLSRTPGYRVLSVAGAAFAGLASTMWIVERLLSFNTRIDKPIDALAHNAPFIVSSLFSVSVACFFWDRSRKEHQAVSPMNREVDDPNPR